MRIWNSVVEVSIQYACVLAFIGYAQVGGKIQNRDLRLTTTAGTTTYRMASICEGRVVVQLIAAWLGLGDIGVRRFLGPIVASRMLTWELPALVTMTRFNASSTTRADGRIGSGTTRKSVPVRASCMTTVRAAGPAA